MKKLLWILIALAGLVVALVAVCDLRIRHYAAPYLYERLSEVPPRHAALLLGTSSNLRDGRPNLFFRYRIDAATALLHAGKVDKILVSGDTARKSYYYSYTYAVGLPYIIKTWCPRLIEEAEEAGIDGKALVEDIFVNNPRECFTFKNRK